jgi:hypothetical protein
MFRVCASSNYWATYVNLLRDSTTLFLGDASTGRNRTTSMIATNVTDSNDNGFLHYHTITYLDSPATSVSVTYKLQGSGRVSSYVMYVNRSVPDRASTEFDSRMASSLVVMEIAA